jgi:hypothetical protein
VNRKFRVVAGPYRVARKYAMSQGWTDDEIMIVSRGHQLAVLDPALIASIITVKLHTMGARVINEIRDEIENIHALWPQIHTVAAA